MTLACTESEDGTATGKAAACGGSAGAGATTTGAATGASAGAGGTAGAQAPAEYRKGMQIFIIGKGGLMYEATIGGQKFDFQPISAE